MLKNVAENYLVVKICHNHLKPSSQFVLTITKKIERIIHKGLTKLRHNPHREFFKLSVDEAINLLSGYIISGSAVEVPIKNSFKSDEKAAIKNMQKQRDNISFRSLNIPVGTTLTFANAKHLTVKTANDGRRIILPNGKTTTYRYLSIAYMNPNLLNGVMDGKLGCSVDELYALAAKNQL